VRSVPDHDPHASSSPRELEPIVPALPPLPPITNREFRRIVQIPHHEFDRLVAALKVFESSEATAADAGKLFKAAIPAYRAWERGTAATAVWWGRFYASAERKLGSRFWGYVARHPDEFPALKTLQMYLRIARNPVLCVPRNWDLLPGNIKALDEIIRLGGQTPLQPLLDSGAIHVRTGVEDVVALRKQYGWTGRGRPTRGADPFEKVRQAHRDFMRNHHRRKPQLLGFMQAEILRLDPGATVKLSIEVPDEEDWDESENDDAREED
jgi:hypothetical protein